ncbi:MAG: arginine--tRNA ligase [Dehalococcoidia bacterium]|nr:arginine--tRNA ligase [Dehalococcoidia bacterium]
MLIKELLAQRLTTAFTTAQAQGLLPPGDLPEGVIERPQDTKHGDFASTLPMKAAKTLRSNPMKIAQTLQQLVEKGHEIQKVDVAPPGFINITLSTAWLQQQVEAVRHEGERFGHVTSGAGHKVQVEFVSVNPTGPVHVGHARGAVLGSTLATVMQAAGYNVTREYYVNDAGNQMELFYRSLWARYQQALGKQAEIPENGYRGQYMVELGQRVVQEHGDRFLKMPEAKAIAAIGAVGLDHMITAIKADLEMIGVTFDNWFREKSLFQDSTYATAMKMLEERGYVVRRDGALWFESTKLGEDKDNVLVRSNGLPTYFASDAAYHYNKFMLRGYERVIDIWGADHAGHVSRLKAVVEALGADPSRLTVLLGQMVALKRGGEVVRASKRTGEIVTLRELAEEVGKDAVRFFFLARSPEAQIEFDLELAKQQSQENPVYYLQYAHARIAGILRHAEERHIEYRDGDVAQLKVDEELALIRKLLELPELVESIAKSLEPHRLPHYTMDLAATFHRFYDTCQVIPKEYSPEHDGALTKARLKLVDASRIGLAQCLTLMGMAAPERM